MKTFKWAKSITFTGFLLVLIAAIFNLQTEYASILKAFYNNNTLTYIGMALLCFAWVFWEITVVKTNELVLYIITIAALVISAGLINGIIGIIGFLVAITGITMVLVTKKPSLKKESFVIKGE